MDNQKKGFLRLMPLAFVMGVAGVFAFAPFSLFWLTPLVLAAFYELLRRRPRRSWHAAMLGFCFGMGFFGVGISWIIVSLNVFGGMPILLAALATFLFCAFFALYPAAVAAAFVRLKCDDWRDVILFMVLIAFADWCRSWVLTGFPWLSWGFTQTDGWLSAYAPLIGVVGLSALLALAGACLAQCAYALKHGKDLRQILITVAAGSVILGLGYAWQGKVWTTPRNDSLSVALVQGNIPQQLKWDMQYFRSTAQTYEQMIGHALSRAKLIVLPETAVPVILKDAPDSYLWHWRDRLATAGADLLYGAPTGSTAAYYNSAVSLGASPQQRYDKVHLVPFGETTPPGFAWFMQQIDVPMSDFQSGDRDQSPLTLAEHKIAVDICYEDIFGAEIAVAAADAEILVNLSNTAWFGRSLAQEQHLQIARMRALETGRPVLRATNTGMTALIDGEGQVIAKLRPFSQAILYGEIHGRSGSTPYMRWRDTPVILFLTCALFYFCYRLVICFIRAVCL